MIHDHKFLCVFVTFPCMQNFERQGKVTESIMYRIQHVWMTCISHNIEAAVLRMESPL